MNDLENSASKLIWNGGRGPSVNNQQAMDTLLALCIALRGQVEQLQGQVAKQQNTIEALTNDMVKIVNARNNP